MKKILTGKYLILGLVMLGVILSIKSVYDSFSYSFLTYVVSPAKAENTTHSLPTFINIPIIQTALPIDETSINFGVWEVKKNNASHLSTSSTPSEKGNIIIYAPNTDTGFKRLTSLSKNDEIFITTLDGKLHTYAIKEMTVVSPIELDAIKDTPVETVTLYTNYGFAGLKRFVVRAFPQS